MSASIRIVLMASLALGCMPAHAQSPDRCPGDVDTVVAFERDGNVRGYIGIDVDTDRAYYCDDRGISWTANYVRTSDGFEFDLLARNGIWRRTMRPDNGALVDTWIRDGSRFRTVDVTAAR